MPAVAEVELDLPEWAAGLYEPHRYKSLYGGRGAGRSWAVARVLLDLAMDRPLRILCARQYQVSIRDSVHSLLRDQITLLGLPGYTVLEREIRHASGATFAFAGLEHSVHSIRSWEGVDVCWVEEAQSVSEASWEALVPTIRAQGSEIWLTWNPGQDTDPTWRRFVANPPPDCWTVQVSSADNPWLPEALRRERDYLYRVDPESAAHVWGGELRRTSQAEVLRGKWVVEDGGPQPDWTGPYYGLDFGYSADPTAAVEVWVAGDELRIQGEAYALGLELDATAEALRAALPGCERHVVRADSARSDSISYLARHGLPRVVGVTKGAGSVEDGVAHLRAYRRIVVHPRCRHWIREAGAWRYRVDARSGDVMPDLAPGDDHLMDATRYALEPLIRAHPAPLAAAGALPRSVPEPLFEAA